MKFLVIVQDLRISGTSEGIVSRSFIAKLRQVYPKSVIDVLYFKTNKNDDHLDLLPVNFIETKLVNHKVPFLINWINKIYWRLFHKSLKERFIQNIYANHIKKIDYKKYNHIFIRSSGLEYETILGAKGLPLLKKAIINFHDPYPIFWDTGSNIKLTSLDLFRLKAMKKVVGACYSCITPSKFLSNDLQVLYGSNKVFKTLPHQFETSVFNFSDTSKIRKQQARISICYHGSLQLGRNIDIVLDAYIELIESDVLVKEKTEFVLRLKSAQYGRIRNKYKDYKNIVVLEGTNFSDSYNEQKHESNILILLENYFNYSNILPGKAAVVRQINKRFLSVSPVNSELSRILKGTGSLVLSNNQSQIKTALKKLIDDEFQGKEFHSPFKDYFEIASFKSSIREILNH